MPNEDKDPAEMTDAEKTIKQINDIKANMVPKEDLEKALADRDKFKDALINGAALPDEEPLQSREELAKKMASYSSGNITNLGYIDTALKLREAAIDETGEDPFESSESPAGFGQRVADGLQKMLDEADGRPEAFLGIYQASVKDEKINKPQ